MSEPIAVKWLLSCRALLQTVRLYRRIEKHIGSTAFFFQHTHWPSDMLVTHMAHDIFFLNICKHIREASTLHGGKKCNAQDWQSYNSPLCSHQKPINATLTGTAKHLALGSRIFLHTQTHTQSGHNTKLRWLKHSLNPCLLWVFFFSLYLFMKRLDLVRKERRERKLDL